MILLVTLSKPSINKSITTTKEESILAWRCPRLNLDNDTTYAWSDRKTTPEKGHLTIIINNKSKINFLLIAGVHGDEIVGPMTILKALKEPKKNFNKKINYEIYPLLNPTGYDLNQRNNNDNRDLNCINKITLKSDNYTEIQALTNSLKNKKYNALISLHENLSKDKFYAYVFEKEANPLYREIISNTSEKVEILKSNKIYGAISDGNGLVINYHDH